MKRKAGGLLLVIIVALMTFAVSGCGLKESEGLEFQSNGDGTCSWTGLGTCTDTEIVVPKKNGNESVVSVASDTLNFTVENVTKVVLPETIKTIEEDAFDRVRCLKTIVLKEGLEKIEDSGFNGCEGLEDIKFPSTLKTIGEHAFSDCKLLQEVILPEGLTELGKWSFSGCREIKKISVPSTLNMLHFVAEEGGDCGYEFETTSIEEFEYAGEWNYTSLKMDIDEKSKDLSVYYYGKLARDVSKEEYPGSYFEMTEKNSESVICALFNKDSLKVNGKKYEITKEKPLGKYEVSGAWGFTLQEFAKDDKLNVSYEGWSAEDSVKDIVCGTYEYDKDAKMYVFSGSTNYMGSNIEIEKAFVNFGDFTFSVDYAKIDNDEKTSINKWIPYSEVIKEFIEEDVSKVEEDKLDTLVEKKENLLADLIEAFKAEGITVSVDEVTGELALDASVLFGGDSAVLTEAGKAFLNKFVKAYTTVVYSEKYDGFISKTIVEGHTAPVAGSTYESGLPLSEERANNVKNYCVSSDTGVDVSKLASTLEAVGLSNSKPIYDTSGKVDMAASRRVSFRFIINLE